MFYMIRLLYTLRIHQIYIILLFKKIYFKFIFKSSTNIPSDKAEAASLPKIINSFKSEYVNEVHGIYL